MRHLKNLRSQTALAEVLPWEFVPTKPIPEQARANKAVRDLWICAETTDHHVYSTVVGFNPGQRVSRGKDGGNAPHQLTGLIVDYDCKITEEQAREGFKRVTRPPTHWEKTLSGNGRAVFLFEEPLFVPGYEFCSQFMLFLAEKLNVRLIAPAVDEGALKAPERYYTNSGDWITSGALPVPKELAKGWLVEFSGSFKFNGRDFGVEMPLDKAAEMLAKKFPRFADWPGDFSVGAQGPSFWVEGSSSPKSAIVRETGIQTFAAHADRGFYLWEDLLGREAVENYRSSRLGTATEGVWFDGKAYFRAVADGRIKPFQKEDLMNHLVTARQISRKMEKDGTSPLARAMEHIQNHNYVLGAAPFAFRKPGLIRVSGEPVLNTSTKSVLQPVHEPAFWGTSFPFLSSYFDNFFDPPEQREVFIAWLSVFYGSAYHFKPQAGHSLFIAGGASMGKTMLARGILGKLLGGYSEAANYLMGREDFGSELFENGVWCVDDSESVANTGHHRKFSEIVKRMAANTTFRYHPKFRVPMLVEWQGRVVVTMNRDEESIRLLPDLSLTLLDKIMLFRTRDSYEGTPFRFPRGGTAAVEEILDRELPHFARYLLDYQIPEHLINEANPRFVIKPYHNELLVTTQMHGSSINAFSEILHDWKSGFFPGSDIPFWEGSAFQLHKLLHADPTSAPALRNFSVDAVGRALSALKNRGDTLISCREQDGLRLWRINRPENLPSSVSANQPKSKFQS